MRRRLRKGRLRTLSPGWLAFWAALLLLWPLLFFELHVDGAIFLLGSETLKNGGALYRDFWEIKPPAIYLLNLPVVFLPRDEWSTGFYFLGAVGIGATAILGARVAALLAEKEAVSPRVAALCFAVFYGGALMLTAPTSVGQCESWGNLLGCAALWLWLRGRTWQSGVCAGAILLFKPTALAPFLPLLWLRPAEIGAFLRWGLGVGVAPLMGWLFLQISGGLAALGEIGRGFISPYLSWARLPLSEALPRLLGMAFLMGGRGLGAGVWATGALRKRDWPFWAAILVGFATVWMQGRGFVYHFQTLFPPFCWACALGAARAMRWLQTRGKGWMGRPLLAASLGLFAVQPLTMALLSLRFEGVERAQVLSQFEPDKRGDCVRDARLVTDFLRARHQNGDTLFVWGYEPVIYLRSGVARATRFAYHIPQIAEFAFPIWRQELSAELQQSPPRFFVIARGDDQRWAGSPLPSSLEMWRQNPLAPWFSARYTRVLEVPRFLVYERKAPKPRQKSDLN